MVFDTHKWYQQTDTSYIYLNDSETKVSSRGILPLFETIILSSSN